MDTLLTISFWSLILSRNISQEDSHIRRASVFPCPSISFLLGFSYLLFHTCMHISYPSIFLVASLCYQHLQLPLLTLLLILLICFFLLIMFLSMHLISSLFTPAAHINYISHTHFIVLIPSFLFHICLSDDSLMDYWLLLSGAIPTCLMYILMLASENYSLNISTSAIFLGKFFSQWLLQEMLYITCLLFAVLSFYVFYC